MAPSRKFKKSKQRQGAQTSPTPQTLTGKGTELHGVPVTAQQIWEAMSPDQQMEFASVSLSDLVDYGNTRLEQGDELLVQGADWQMHLLSKHILQQPDVQTALSDFSEKLVKGSRAVFCCRVCQRSSELAGHSKLPVCFYVAEGDFRNHMHEQHHGEALSKHVTAACEHWRKHVNDDSNARCVCGHLYAHDTKELEELEEAAAQAAMQDLLAEEEELRAKSAPKKAKRDRQKAKQQQLQDLSLAPSTPEPGSGTAVGELDHDTLLQADMADSQQADMVPGNHAETHHEPAAKVNEAGSAPQATISSAQQAMTSSAQQAMTTSAQHDAMNSAQQDHHSLAQRATAAPAQQQQHVTAAAFKHSMLSMHSAHKGHLGVLTADRTVKNGAATSAEAEAATAHQRHLQSNDLSTLDATALEQSGPHAGQIQHGQGTFGGQTREGHAKEPYSESLRAWAVDNAELRVVLSCPITKAVMYDPVIAADGHTYERAAMQEWLTRHATSPVTGEKLSHIKLVSNVLIRVILQQHVL